MGMGKLAPSMDRDMRRREGLRLGSKNFWND